MSTYLWTWMYIVYCICDYYSEWLLLLCETVIIVSAQRCSCAPRVSTLFTHLAESTIFWDVAVKPGELMMLFDIAPWDGRNPAQENAAVLTPSIKVWKWRTLQHAPLHNISLILTLEHGKYMYTGILVMCLMILVLICWLLMYFSGSVLHWNHTIRVK